MVSKQNVGALDYKVYALGPAGDDPLDIKPGQYSINAVAALYLP